ncbi:MAG: hypothetical protein Q8M29_14985 [Bacteroidota bacterium]|nr:hypothetical protein [Bacteroidota bacterium]
MKKTIALFSLILSLGVNAQTKTATKPAANKSAKKTDASNVMLGTWTGDMVEKKLTIVIEKVDGDKIIGYNTLGKNKRPLKGTFIKGAWDVTCSIAFDATLKEPGDDKWDGVFTVKFVGDNTQGETDDGPVCKGDYKGVEGVGQWKSNNGKMTKDFTLTKSK